MSPFGTSRHSTALRKLVVIRAKLTSIKPDRSSSIDEQAGILVDLPGRRHPGRFTRADEIAHARHAKIARRITGSQAVAVAPTGQISSINSHRLISLDRPSTAPNRLRPKTNFLSGFKLIGVSSPGPFFPKIGNYGTLRHPASTRGAYASSRTRGGMQWTRMASQDERCRKRTAKACGPDLPTLGSSLSMIIGKRRWQKSPVTGESAL